MILVDIYVPAIDQTMDFELDEYASISNLLEEIGEMIIQTAKGEIRKEDAYKMMLCSYDLQSVLENNKTLEEYNIRNGSRLFIV